MVADIELANVIMQLAAVLTMMAFFYAFVGCQQVGRKYEKEAEG